MHSKTKFNRSIVAFSLFLILASQLLGSPAIVEASDGEQFKTPIQVGRGKKGDAVEIGMVKINNDREYLYITFELYPEYEDAGWGIQ